MLKMFDRGETVGSDKPFHIVLIDDANSGLVTGKFLHRRFYCDFNPIVLSINIILLYICW